MNRISIMAVLCLPLLFGCSKAEEKKSPPVLAKPGQAAKTEEARAPHYHGLVEEYQAILVQDPRNLAALVALGNAYFDSGEWKKAISTYEQALLIEPRNADVRTDMGTSYRQTGMPDRALAEYRLALQYEPAHLNARYNMGIVLAYDKKNYRAAIRIWEDLLKLAPNFPHADRIRSNIASLKQGTGKDGR
jgi:tetratricopeptide (TPR) repeat protein